jgi:hypothetical protein
MGADGVNSSPRFLPCLTQRARSDMVAATGLDASDRKWLDVILLIIDRKAEPLAWGRDGQATAWWGVELNGWPMAVLWAFDTATIITVRRRADYERTAQRAAG